MAKKVLIIDDSATQLNSLKIFFKREGWEVDTAKNGVAAFVQVHKDPPDVIISDVLMPHMTGFQLCRLLKSESATAKIPIALLTVLDKQIDKFWASQSGADSFVMKNGDFESIIQKAKELVEKFPLQEEDKGAIKSRNVSEEDILTSLNKILDDSLMGATLTNKFRSIVDYTSSEETLARKIFDILSTILDYDVAGLFFSFPDKSVKKHLVLDTRTTNISALTAKKMAQRLLNDDDNEPVMLDEVQGRDVVENIEEFQSYIEFEFTHGKDSTGRACFYSKSKMNWSKHKFIDTIKLELDLFFRLKYLYDSTKFLSLIDDLTGLYTRRHLDYTLSQEFERAKRYRTKVAVAMADIDNFKNINDTYGHQAGDIIIKEVSQIFKDNLRKTDFVYRYGGEEIIVVMPETPLENTAIPLERIRKDIEKKAFEIGEKKTINATISIGAAAYGKGTGSYLELIETADQALYKAKKTGKNKVILTDE